MRMWAKKLVRLTAASRAASQGGSSSSSTVRQAKASRLRAASVIARNVRPWLKLCSSSYPWFFGTLKLERMAASLGQLEEVELQKIQLADRRQRRERARRM